MNFSKESSSEKLLDLYQSGIVRDLEKSQRSQHKFMNQNMQTNAKN